MKAIQILHHCPPRGVNFWEGILEGWHSKTGKAIKKINEKLEIECWQPIISQKCFAFRKDRILYRLFSSIQPQFNATLSPTLLHALKKEYEKDTKLIIHVHGDRALLTYQVLQLFGKKGHNIFIQHHGSGGHSVFTPIEKRLLKYAKKIYAASKNKENYLRKLGLDGEKVRVQTMGVDYEHFRPMDKAYARRKIGVKEDKFAILYVGKFYERKGLRVVVKAFEQLRKKYDVCLILIGGTVDDPLYPYLTKIANKYENEMIYRFRIPNSEMPLFYSASDVMCWYVNDTPIWGGIGVTIIESLACNTPVVSNTLVHFAKKEEIDKVGVVPHSKDQMSRCIEKLINHSAEMKCREISRKYYDWNMIARNTLSDYFA